MPWTFEQRIQRACDALLEKYLIEDSQIETLRRPLFYGIHALGVGLSLEPQSWGEWVGIKDQIASELSEYNVTIQSNQRTYQFNIFSSDPQVLRWLYRRRTMFSINHIRIVDRSCWQLKLPRPRPKGKFYGEFSYRIGFKNRQWGRVPENLTELDKLSGAHKLVIYPRTFLYLDKLNDVLLFKLVLGEQLLSLEDRHLL